MSHEPATQTTTRLVLPALIAGAGDRAALRFLEYFTVNLRNKNTRAAYGRASADFLHRSEGQGIDALGRVQPVHVAAYIELRQALGSDCQATSGLYSDAVRLARRRTGDADKPGSFGPGAAPFGIDSMCAGTAG